MRKSMFLLIIVAAFLTCAATSAISGDVYLHQNSEGNIAVAEKVSSYTVGEVKELMERACTGFSLALMYEFDDGKIKVYRGEIEPNGYISLHYGPTTWACCMVEGEGEFQNADYDLNLKSSINWKPGDVIVCKPNGMHAWKNGPKKTVFIGVEQAPGK